MAEQDSTTKTPPKGRETSFTLLSDAVGLALEPVKLFIELLDESSSGELEQALLVLRALLDKQKADLKKIYEAIDQTLGMVSLETPMYGEIVEFAGRKFKYPDFIRAVVKPLKLQAVPKGGE